jgi:hypothetical protein
MKLTKIKHKAFLFLVLAVLGLSFQACSSERKVAIAYTKKAPSISIMVLKPAQLFKVNQKVYLLDSIGSVSPEKKAAVLLENSLFLKQLNDTLFIANYMLGYTKELTKFEFNVYTESEMDTFMQLDSNTVQISVAQIELEETLYTFRDETQVFGQQYYHDHNLNAVYVNSWFEISPLNKEPQVSSVYFATDMLVDQVDGVFDYDQFSGEMRYMFNIDSINTDMLYNFAYDLGRVYAGYTFDYLMNKDIDKNVPEEKRTERYWRFDPYSTTFFLAGDDRFISLDE